MIDYTRDYMFDYFGFKTLERAYLIKNQKTKYIYERPQHMWMRVAAFLNQDNLAIFMPPLLFSIQEVKEVNYLLVF